MMLKSNHVSKERNLTMLTIILKMLIDEILQ